jgi:hypothetical protein
MQTENNSWYVWVQLREFLDLTKGEMNSFNEVAAREGETPFMRRTKVRIVFSCVEALVFHLKSSSLALTADNPGLFTNEESLELQDLRPDKKGGVRKAKIALKDSIKMAFSSFGKAMGKAYTIDFGTEEGARFISAIEIRDRITHPKCPSSWDVSESDTKIVDEAWLWFGRHLVAVSKPNAAPLRSDTLSENDDHFK